MNCNATSLASHAFQRSSCRNTVLAWRTQRWAIESVSTAILSPSVVRLDPAGRLRIRDWLRDTEMERIDGNGCTFRGCAGTGNRVDCNSAQESTALRRVERIFIGATGIH